ncbi:MAG: formylglycine-generating enzyme family protein [Pirellulales bacterium]|nr:formylglycine-generating enzyme family protein [Pirellulales bacterium]
MTEKLAFIFRGNGTYVFWSGALLAGAVLLNYGIWYEKPALQAAGAVAMIAALAETVALRLRGRDRKTTAETPQPVPTSEKPASPSPSPRPARPPADPHDVDALVEQMLAEGRVALLLRPQIAGNLSEEQFGQAISVLTETTALVPDGEVALDEGDSQRVVSVGRFFLDRYPVTNREYYEFVSTGGYRQMALWDEAILPALMQFLDRTGQPGPKYWSDGCYPPGEEKHPVTGVSWYEAFAYARWVGKRLPTDAEWVKAGAWPVPLSNSAHAQRRFPWGDVMDRTRANLYGSGPGRTVPVDHYPGGVSVGGVYQLVGNVWEWTTGNYRGSQLPAESLPPGGLSPEMVLKNLRGGAYDTYFDNQATCQFSSGENPLGRRRNIGFRCAVGVCDLTLVRKGVSKKEADREVCIVNQEG